MTKDDLISRQPKHTEKRTKTHACDCISRQAAIDEVSKYASIWMEYDGGMTQEEVAEAALKAAKRTMVHILEELPSAQPERKKMSNKEWIDFLSVQFTVSRTTAREMLHALMKWKAEDNFKKEFSSKKDGEADG